MLVHTGILQRPAIEIGKEVFKEKVRVYASLRKGGVRIRLEIECLRENRFIRRSLTTEALTVARTLRHITTSCDVMRRWNRQIVSMADEGKATSHMLVYTQNVCNMMMKRRKQ